MESFPFSLSLSNPSQSHFFLYRTIYLSLNVKFSKENKYDMIFQMIDTKDSKILLAGENFTFNLVLGATRLLNEPRYGTNQCMVFTYHPYMINHVCYSLPDDENIAAHYNDFHHRNLAYVPANACLLLLAIVVNAAAVKVLYQEYILKFWIFEIVRFNGFYATIYL